MKKFFTLIAAALMAVGANAQTVTVLDENYAQKATDGVDAFFTGSVVRNTADQSLKVNDTKVYPFSYESVLEETDVLTSSALYFRFNTVNSMGLYLGGTNQYGIKNVKAGDIIEVATTNGSAGEDAAGVAPADLQNATLAEETGIYTQNFNYGGKARTLDFTVYTLTVGEDGLAGFSLTAAYVGRITVKRAPATIETVASWNQGTASGATFTAVGTCKLDYSGKIHSNKDAVTAMTFPNSGVSSGEFVNYVKMEGDFKAGDIITIQPFTNMSTGDFTGSANADGVPTKYANIVLYTADGNVIQDMTGSAAGALTVTDGHEEAADPKEFTYTLENDYSVICFARQGNTRISIIKVTVERPVAENPSTGINTVDATVNNGKWYNLQGQEVAAPTKGLFIKDGKKYVIK